MVVRAVVVMIMVVMKAMIVLVFWLAARLAKRLCIHAGFLNMGIFETLEPLQSQAARKSKGFTMKIGDLATASGTPADTIRYYEREGLLPLAARTEANYRQYESMHLEQLLFIRHCRNLDMSLDEVRELLAVRDEPESDCEAANRVLDEHIDHVTQRIKELRALERQLKELRARCATAKRADECGILVGLADAAAVPDASQTVPRSAPRHLHQVHGPARTSSRPS